MRILVYCFQELYLEDALFWTVYGIFFLFLSIALMYFRFQFWKVYNRQRVSERLNSLIDSFSLKNERILA